VANKRTGLGLPLLYIKAKSEIAETSYSPPQLPLSAGYRKSFPDKRNSTLASVDIEH